MAERRSARAPLNGLLLDHSKLVEIPFQGIWGVGVKAEPYNLDGWALEQQGLFPHFLWGVGIEQRNPP